MPPHLIIMDKVVLLGVIFKKRSVSKTQMMPLSDHQNPVDMHTSIIMIMCINIIQNIKAVAPKL